MALLASIKSAVDDFGGGVSDFQKIIEISPNYIKLDRYFSKDLRSKTRKQSVVKFLVNYCIKYKMGLILEGLESNDEIALAKSLGVYYGQGFGLGKPSPLRSKTYLKGLRVKGVTKNESY